MFAMGLSDAKSTALGLSPPPLPANPASPPWAIIPSPAAAPLSTCIGSGPVRRRTGDSPQDGWLTLQANASSSHAGPSPLSFSAALPCAALGPGQVAISLCPPSVPSAHHRPRKIPPPPAAMRCSTLPAAARLLLPATLESRRCNGGHKPPRRPRPRPRQRWGPRPHGEPHNPCRRLAPDSRAPACLHAGFPPAAIPSPLWPPEHKHSYDSARGAGHPHPANFTPRNLYFQGTRAAPGTLFPDILLDRRFSSISGTFNGQGAQQSRHAAAEAAPRAHKNP